MAEKNNRMYNVPNGYFESLNTRLSQIPFAEEKESTRVVTWAKVRPVVALAASFAFLVVCGTTILNLTSKSVVADDYDYYQFAYNMIPQTEPYSLYDESLAESLAPSVSQDDIINYLIDSGISVEQIYENE